MISAEDFIFDPDDNRNQNSNTKLAVVSGVFSNGTAKVLFDGEDAPSEKQYAYLSTYSPKDGDKVLMFKAAGSYILVGKIIYDKPPNGKKVDDLSPSASTSVLISKVNELIGVLRSYGLIS